MLFGAYGYNLLCKVPSWALNLSVVIMKAGDGSMEVAFFSVVNDHAFFYN